MKIILDFFNSNDWVINVLVVVGVTSFIFFCYFYVFKSLKINSYLKNCIKQIKKLGDLKESQKREAFNKVFEKTQLQNIWAEYSETLHDQFESDGAETLVKKTRSTLPSQVFFNQQVVIETPLAVEFFKHLPGVLTGLGIIGTFYGLINGLSTFDTTDPEKINESLTLLLKSVEHAFVFSALAISFAIFVTILEKILLERGVHYLDELNLQIDRQFDAGVGEEYLSDLVKHSQENSAQTRMLKDSLVNDLKVMLANLLEEQSKQNLQLTQSLSASYKEASEHTATKISESVENSLKGPLEDIAKAVNSATDTNTGQVEGLLQNVLVAFMEKLDATFGRQFDGLHDMMGQSVAAITTMQDGFSQLIQEMKDTSTASANAIQEKLVATIEDMNKAQIEMQKIMTAMLEGLQAKASEMNSQAEESSLKMAEQLKKLFDESEQRQQKMAEQMQTFIDDVKQSMVEGQQETMDKIYGSVTQIESKFEDIFESFKSSRKEMDEESRFVQEELHKNTAGIMTSVGDKIDGLLTTLEEERIASRDLVERIADVANKSITEMTKGAEKIGNAADKFTDASDNLSDVTEEIEEVMNTVSKSTSDISNGLSQLSRIIDDYKQLRDSVQKTFDSIQGVVVSSQADASARKQLINDLEIVSAEMKRNNKEAAQYLEGINDVLAKSFDEFGDGITKSLTKVTGSLDNNLSDVVNRISSGFEDLTEYVEDLSDVFEKSINKTR